jgi:hypothetical protein
VPMACQDWAVTKAAPRVAAKGPNRKGGSASATRLASHPPAVPNLVE